MIAPNATARNIQRQAARRRWQALALIPWSQLNKFGAEARLPLHIAIDAHSVGAQLAGNETYAVNLIEALAEINQANQYTLYVTKQSAADRFKNRWANFNVKRTLPHTPLVRIPVTLSAELRRNPVDVLHVQYTAPPLAPCAVVATIHDLAFEHLPETFNRRSWMQLRLTVRNTARRAAHIITVSEYSRQDLIKTYGIDPERVMSPTKPRRLGSRPSQMKQICDGFERLTGLSAITFWRSDRSSRARI